MRDPAHLVSAGVVAGGGAGGGVVGVDETRLFGLPARVGSVDHVVIDRSRAL